MLIRALVLFLFFVFFNEEGKAAAHFQNQKTVDYIIQEGDTLSLIAHLYFDRMADIQSIARRSRVSLDQPLHAGFHLQIPKSLLRRTITNAVVAHVSGPVFLYINGQKGTLEQGRPVTEQTTIETGASGFVTLMLPDGSRVSMPSMSLLTITRLRKVALTDAIERSFKLEAGHVRVYAVPLFRSDSYFHIATPASLAAVRGTNFRVYYKQKDKAQKKENTIEVLDGLVMVDNRRHKYAVPGGYGTNYKENKGFPLVDSPMPKKRLTIFREVNPDIPLSVIQNVQSYHATVARDADFLDLLSESWPTTGNILLSGLADGHYYLRLSAVDNHDLEGQERVVSIDHKTGHIETSAYSVAEGAVFQWIVKDDEPVLCRLQLVAGKISEPATPLVDQLGGKKGTVKVSSLPEGDYSWRIIATWPAGGEILSPFHTLHVSRIEPMQKNE
ncbi:MAG: FecR domain-containing protein [Zymomonas mobilis subsp. pomaceae]|uniref:LysM domain protein n=1 Tax=Zymomonas mobilis subsp. pomaceae (strain ATCC 29192 / DSM 22645 / JCM 10191 / CCUG 17912 / NBRC 13757 / NCIMB 11200 / NRRL B-4491 / Barker I) TaxID=579138 RepID=F8ES66_ZYMMT|nr:FecR domain-containing protein [Zymomonas mobilis]AEI37641.1 LysM domain protein [Zymomonas mobilis subsp. pomaceae ATCC 29192]MDX5949008.1 FecR domain-containing protein [Zymomonas mobilis subsp. pomaceae]GEB88813.1 peptidase M23 [Zymomonas mobilis subsp. pomaceae]